MEHSAATGVPPAATGVRCPICVTTVYPDSAGYVECPCGWGGPGDPVESAHGFSRWVTLFDRRQASRIAWRDLKRIAERKKPDSPRSALYFLALVALSALTYLVLGALLTGAIILAVQNALAGVWLAVILDAVVIIFLYGSIFGFPTRVRGVIAPLADYPRLETLVSEVASQLNMRAPRWVILNPDASFYIGSHMLWGRAALPQTVLGVGAGALAMLTEQELRSILAHELAHHKLAHTFVSHFFARAETALHNVISAARLGMRSQVRGSGSSRVFGSSDFFVTTGILIAVALVWIVTLPLRPVWLIFHLLRMRLSRAQEFGADAFAVRLYGAKTFVSAFTGLTLSMRTVSRTRSSIRQEMARHNNPNFYAELRRHYAELPAEYMDELRLTSTYAYRTIQSTHPTSPDRVRAALIEATPDVIPPHSDAPAWPALTPKGATSPDATELQLTRLLFR